MLRDFLEKPAGVGPLLRLKRPSVEAGGLSDEEAQRQAEALRQRLARRYNVSPYLGGSMATGLNLPGQADFDYGIPVKSRAKFDRIVKRLAKSAKPSPYDMGGTDYRVFQTEMDGVPVDIAVLLGGKGSQQRTALRRAAESLTPERRQEILRKKLKLKRAIILPEYRYKRFKRGLDEELGLPRFRREKIASLVRRDVYGHRTQNIEPLLQTGRLMSAAEAADRGLIKEVETPSMFSRKRVAPSEDHRFRDEVFMARGLLPPSSTYGRYGVLFRSRKAAPSRYLNMVPEEYTAKTVGAKALIFVVPDEEVDHWREKYPDRKIISETEVPDSKRIQSSRSVAALLQRLPKAKLRQDTRTRRVRPGSRNRAR